MKFVHCLYLNELRRQMKFISLCVIENSTDITIVKTNNFVQFLTSLKLNRQRETLASEDLLQITINQLCGERIELRFDKVEGGELVHATGFGAVHLGDFIVLRSQLGADLVRGAQQVVARSLASLGVLLDFFDEERLNWVELLQSDSRGAEVARDGLPDQSTTTVQKTRHHLWKHFGGV